MKNKRKNEENVKVIFATEGDDVALNCDGEPCNFSYNKNLSDD